MCLTTLVQAAPALITNDIICIFIAMHNYFITILRPWRNNYNGLYQYNGLLGVLLEYMNCLKRPFEKFSWVFAGLHVQNASITSE